MTITREPRGIAQPRSAQLFFHWVGCISVAFAVIGGMLTVVMALHVTADVTGRNLFNSPIQGTIEYITYWWMPMIVFLSAPYVEQKHAHITVTLVTDSLQGAARRRAAILTRTVTIVVAIFVLYMAVLSFWESFSIGQIASGGVPLPIWVGKGVMVLGLGQLLLQMIANSLELLQSDNSERAVTPVTRGTSDDN